MEYMVRYRKVPCKRCVTKWLEHYSTRTVYNSHNVCVPVYLPGTLFSAYNMVAFVAQLVGAVLLNSVYQATLGLAFQGYVFILCALLVLIPFALVR